MKTFKITSVIFFIADFNLLILRLKCYIESFDVILKQNKSVKHIHSFL